jgi:hypothetical protein
MTAVGAAYYQQLPPQARSLIRRPPSLPVLAVSYASFLAALAMISLSSNAALSNMLTGATGFIVVSRLAIALWLLRQNPRRRSTGSQRRA